MKLSALFRTHATPKPQPKPAARPAPSPVRAVDSFQAARPPLVSLTPPPSPPMQRAVSSAASAQVSAVTGPVKSPYEMGRVKADGRQMVGESGEAFTWRGVSEFLLPKYLNDRSRSPEENEKIVAGRLDERVQQGDSVVRVFGTIPWAGAELRPFDDWEGYKANTEKLFQLAQERGLYVEFTAFTAADETVPKDKRGEYLDWVAQTTRKYPNTFVEICNESFKNGLGEQEVYDLARRFKQTAPEVMVAGSSATGDGIDGSATDGSEFGRAPFDYVTVHSERSDGDGGYRWVRHLREGESIGGTTGKPVVQDEPMGSAGASQPGRRDSDPAHFRDAALVAAITGQGFTFHTERAVTQDPYAAVPEPGADQVHLSDLIPPDNRGTHFVNGHWPDSPFDVGDQFEKNVLRVFTRAKNDGSGFWTYPVDVTNDLNLQLKSATHLTVKDVGSGDVVVDRDFAAGEVLHLPKGSDVLIAGGAATFGELKAPSGTPGGEPQPPNLGSSDPLPAQRPSSWKVPERFTPEAATELTQQLYRGLLGREADAGGLQGYAAALQQGRLLDVVNGLVGSDEFRARTGLTTGGVGTDLYRALLGRNPDPDGLAATEDTLRTGRLADRVIGMVLSDEARARR